MNKRYKSISIFSLIIGFVFLCAFIFMPFIKTNKSVFAEEGNNLLYAFVSKQEGIAVHGKIYVDFGLSIDVGGDGEITRSDAETMVENKIVPFESAKIYLRTRNMSAISEEGDYEAIDQSFTVLGTSPFTSIAVKINNVGLQVGNVARQLCVEIYKVEITGLKEGYDSKELHEIREISSKTLSTGAEFSIGQKKYTVSYAGNGFNVGDNLNILDLSYYSYLAPETLCFDVNENTSFNDIKIDLANISNGWYNKIKYLSDHDMLKLGIRVSMSANEAPNGVYTDNSFVGVQIFGGNANGVGAPTFNEDGPTNNLYSNASVVELARWFAKFQSNETESLAISKAFNGEFEDVTVGTLFNENILLSEKLIQNEYGPAYDFGQGGVYDDYIVENGDYVANTFLIDDLGSALKGSTTISTRVWSYLSGKDKFYSGYTNFVPINYQARVESATFGQIYKDQDGKEKVGVSLRFSEPVQITKNKDGNLKAKPYINGQLNGNSDLAVTFHYASGDGTDTLYFEADVSTVKTHITRIALNGAYDFENVYDFAPNSATGGSSGTSQHLNVMDKSEKDFVNGWDANVGNKTYICSYDLYIPNIRISGEPTKQVKTSHTVLISPENISQTGKIFYGWITENESEPQTLSSVPVSGQNSQMIFSPPNISGVRYLYVYAVSELGKKSEVVKYGPLHFDNDKPTLEVKRIDDGYKQQEFEITITNKSPIENFERFAELKNNLKLFVASDVNGLNIEYEFPVWIKDVEQLTKESVKVSSTLTAEQLEIQQETEKEYGEYYIFFSISDALENQGVSQPISCYFDVRDIFSVEIKKNDFEMDEFTKGKLSLDKNYYTLDLSKIGEGKTLEFSTEELTSISIDTFVRVNNIDKNLHANLTGKDNNDGTIEISINQKVEPGLYSLVLKDKASGSNKKTLPIYFYVTNGKDKESGLYQEQTGGYQAVINNVAFTNKVFQIPSSVSYYYKNADDTVVKENYGNGNRPIFFSSKDIAQSYILYREYLDLYAVTLTPTLANYLNSGSASEYRKADGVTQKAVAGQVWIRYKEMNWKPETTINDWVYYYYGADSSALPIKVKDIGGELERALDTVSRMICSYGEELDLVTEEYLDKYGAPTIRADQMRLLTESREASICGTLFAEPALYLGDTGIHFPLEAGVPLSSNTILPFGENRRFYYKSSGDEYRDLIMDSRETFGEYINETGKFTILEIDENGAREYYVYIDKSAPKLKLSWTATKEENEILDEKNGNSRTIYGNNFCIESIEDEDTLSFVAIYRYTNQGEGDLLHVHRKSDGTFPLDDGKYYIQVSDRSGNSYVFILQAKSTPLEFTVKEVDNSYIRVELNREEEEVRYQVYLDNKLLTTDYREKRFTESGIYRFIIEDDYGNRHEETYEFTRDIPQVSWSYQNSDGIYVSYDKETYNEKITIEEDGDEQNYVISTSTYLRFELLTAGCTYEVLSGNPNPNKNISSGWVTLGNKTPFTIKFYYESEPSTYVIYSCRIDDIVPQISVSYEQKYYKPFEITQIEKNLANGTYKLGKDESGKDELYKIYNFTPTSIGFAVDKDAFGAEKSTTLYVANGQKVQSKYFKVEVSDENGVKEVKIYCDGKLVITKESDFSNIYLSRRGAYQIVATDNFGNTTTFSFVNDYEEKVEYFVDGEKMPTDVPFADNFVANGYKEVECGKSQAEIKILSSAEVHYVITDADGKTYYFGFVVEGGKLYNFQYLVKIVKGEKINENGEVVAVDEIESISARGITPLVSGEIAKIGKGVAIYLSTNNDGTLLLSVRSTDTAQKKYTVETRVSPLENQTEMPYYFKTEISTIPSFVEFIDKDKNPIESAQTIKVNDAFAIRNTLGEEIQSVQVAYSQTGTYTDYKAVAFGSYFEEEGMYHVKIINRYGVQTDYYVVLSSQFLMSATIKYIDIGETTIEYSKDYTKEYNDFYSNYSVEVFVYSTNVKVFLNDEEIRVLPTEQGYTAIYINTPGTYRLRVEDEFGNVQEKKIVINAKDLELDENLLTNFNENALRRDENYTNQEIFLNKKVIDESEIAFISMTYGDRTITILDKISEVKKAFDEKQSIGTLGDGEYTLIFKDCYGNKAETVIHYCGKPTLSIIRKTLNGVDAEMFSPLEILDDGVWTNDKVSFFISATKYELKVDGKENVKSIDYDTKTKDEYEVEYLDEYGFKYSFTVYLHREDIVIQPAESMLVSQVSDMLVTKDSVQILFTENASCRYTLNNEPEKTYEAGDILYKDGVYRFKAVDKAGNVSTYTVKKDSAVEYRLEGAGANEILVNGGVTNSHSVKFYAENADNAYIKKVFHNNKFIEYDDEIFTERGKWELIVADDVGNESYFRFYILYGKIDGFTYNTPYNYEIKSVIWGMEDSIVNITDTVVKEQGLRLEATENGKYTVTMESSNPYDVISFTFTIDTTPPQAELVGCQQNEKTINNITLKGCSVGDVVYVYKDGKLVKTVRIDSDYMDPPTISEAGKYKIIVENEAGLQTEFSFERKYVPNVAGSVLIIVLGLASVVGLFVGLIWRNHSKTDD